MPSANPRATATMRISSTSEPEVEDDPFLVVFDLATSRYSRLAGLFVTGGSRLCVGGRVGPGGLGPGDGLLVDGLARHFFVDRGRGLRRRVVQHAALDDLLRAGV